VSRADQDGAARDQIAYIVSQFVSFQQLQGPLLQAFEDIAKTAVEYAEMKQEAAAMRAMVGERDAGIAAAEARADVAETGLAEALAEIEGQRAQIADLAKERDARAEIKREANELKATLAEREAALRRAEQEAQEHTAAALAMQSKIAVLRDDLARAERAEQERAAAAVTLEVELGTMRETLAQTELEAQQRAVAATALQSEMTVLRGRMARTEREVQERVTAAVASRAEISTLLDTLTAAREAGKAAITAFRIDTAALPKRDTPRGWQAVMRIFGAQPSF
jgi:chromosome segregation ATPase